MEENDSWRWMNSSPRPRAGNGVTGRRDRLVSRLQLQLDGDMNLRPQQGDSQTGSLGEKSPEVQHGIIPPPPPCTGSDTEAPFSGFRMTRRGSRPAPLGTPEGCGFTGQCGRFGAARGGPDQPFAIKRHQNAPEDSSVAPTEPSTDLSFHFQPNINYLGHFELTLRISGARRCSRSDTKGRLCKLPESSARKMSSSGIKIPNKVSRKVCASLSWTEECVSGGPSRREAQPSVEEGYWRLLPVSKADVRKAPPPALRAPSSKHTHAHTPPPPTPFARARRRAEADSAHK